MPAITRRIRRGAVFLAAASALSLGGVAAQSDAPRPLALGGPAPRVRTERELRAFLDDLEAQELLLAEGVALESYYQWRGATNHYTAPFSRFATELVGRRDYAALLDRWRGRVGDSTLARRLELHRRDFLVARADPALAVELVTLQSTVQDTVSAFRFQLGETLWTRTALHELADSSSDRSLRRAAAEAALQIAPRLRPRIDHAFALQQRIARQEGFPNAAAAGLLTSSLEPARVLEDIDAFEASTRPILEAMLARIRADLQVDTVQAWDVGYWLHLQERAAGTEAWPKDSGTVWLARTMRGLGFGYDTLPITVTIRDVPTGGITFPVRPGYEARLLSNPFSGSNFYETLFHEYGHALNTALMRPDLTPIFLRGDETPLAEGLAETLGFFAYDRHWLERVAHVPAAGARRLELIGKLQLLLWMRRTICLNAYVEITQYGNPRLDVDSLMAASVRRFTGVEPTAGDLVGTRDMYVTGPLYLQSYLYADMIAAQLHETMRDRFGVEDLSADPRVGPWLTEQFFAPGGSVPWPEKIRRATGRPLSPDALARYFADAVPAAAH